MALKQTVDSLTTHGVTGVYILCRILGSCGVAELMDYLLHRLIGFLSGNHMKDHLVQYGPRQDQRLGEGYVDATHNEIAIGNVGLEWLVPSGIILSATVALLWFFHVPTLYQVDFVGTTLMCSLVFQLFV